MSRDEIIDMLKGRQSVLRHHIEERGGEFTDHKAGFRKAQIEEFKFIHDLLTTAEARG